MIFPFSHFLMLFLIHCVKSGGAKHSGVPGKGLFSVSFPQVAQGFACWPILQGERNSKRGATSASLPVSFLSSPSIHLLLASGKKKWRRLDEVLSALVWLIV